MMDLLQSSPIAWIAISFAIFVAVAVKMSGKSIVSTLDSKIATIRSEIETAEKLRAEAQGLLADFEARQRDAEAEAARIIEEAKASALTLQARTQAELAESMARREAQLTERLKRVEEKAIADIQNHAAELALQATREIVTRTVDEKANAGLIDQAIAAMAKHLN